MKKLLFLFVLFGASMMSEAAKYEKSFGNGSSYKVEGSYLYIDVATANDLSGMAEAMKQTFSALANNATSIVLSGIPSQADVTLCGQYPLQGNVNRLDLTDVTTTPAPTTMGGAVVNVILPKGTTVPENPNDCKGSAWNGPNYVMALSADGASITVSRKSGDTNWEQDPRLNDADVIFLKGNFTAADKEALESKFPGKTILMDGEEMPGYTTSDLVIDADTEDVAAQIAAHNTETQKIGKLTITGKLTDLNVMNGVTVKSVDLSGLTNESLDGLVLPTTSGEIALPGGVTYAGGSVSIAADTTLEQLAQALKVLGDNGKSVTTIPLPGGGTIVNGVVSGVADANVAATIAALNPVVSITGITFASGTIYSNGKLTTVPADDDTAEHLKAKADIVRNAGLTISSLRLSDNTEWQSDGSLLTNEDDEDTQQAIVAKLNAAGFTVDTSKITVNAFSGTYVTVSKGVATLTIPAGQTFEQIKDQLTNEEKTALKEAVRVRLVGTFESDFNSGLYGFLNDNLEELNLLEAVIPSTMQLQKYKSSLKTLTLPSSASYTDIPQEFFNNATALEKLVIPGNIKTIGKTAFQRCTSLEVVEFAEPGNLEVIGESAFEGSALKGVLNIPSSVKRIEAKAFKGVLGISTIIIPENSQLEYIGSEAFVMDNTTSENALKNVYVNVHREIECELNAFDFFNTDGQTQLATVKTRLHYPTELYDFYVGQYKKNINGGYIQGQSHLLEMRNGAANGWQRFVSSGLPVTKDTEWRSYSDDVSLIVPSPHVDEEANVEMRCDVYVVNDYINGNAQLVLMRPGDVIPAKTGLIIHFDILERYEDKGTVIYFEHASKEQETAYPNPYNNEAFPDNLYLGQYRNYLKPINTQGGVMHIDNVEYEEGKPHSNKTKTYRNFFFGHGKMLDDAFKTEAGARYKGKDWEKDYEEGMGWGFFRAVSADYSVNSKAFLHFPVSVFTNPQGGAMGEDHSTTASANAKSFGFVMINTDGEDITDYELENDGVATTIGAAAVGNDNSCYYTLQGIRVERPTAGIYIKNGKKVVVR